MCVAPRYARRREGAAPLYCPLPLSPPQSSNAAKAKDDGAKFAAHCAAPGGVSGGGGAMPGGIDFSVQVGRWRGRGGLGGELCRLASESSPPPTAAGVDAGLVAVLPSHRPPADAGDAGVPGALPGAPQIR